jgi:hypothetical protein
VAILAADAWYRKTTSCTILAWRHFGDTSETDTAGMDGTVKCISPKLEGCTKEKSMPTLIRKPIKTSLSILLFIAGIILPTTVLAQDNKDWILKVHTEELQRQFNYKGSKLEGIEKITVEYFHESNPADLKGFEKIYYKKGRPIGMERDGVFGVSPAEIVAIRVSDNGSASRDQLKSIANIVRRLALNTTLNHSQLISTILPIDCFDGVVQELEDVGFGPSRVGGEMANEAKAILGLESNPPAKKQKLYFY